MDENDWVKQRILLNEKQNKKLALIGFGYVLLLVAALALPGIYLKIAGVGLWFIIYGSCSFYSVKKQMDEMGKENTDETSVNVRHSH